MFDIYGKRSTEKTFYDKRFVDTPDGEPSATWRLSPWKVFYVYLVVLLH